MFTLILSNSYNTESSDFGDDEIREGILKFLTIEFGESSG